MICGCDQVSCFDKGVCPLPDKLQKLFLTFFGLCFIGKDLIRSFGNDLIWITEKVRGPEVTIKKQQQKNFAYKMPTAFNILITGNSKIFSFL